MEWLLVVVLVLEFVFVLVGVAFFTLLERKVLGYIQVRSGPNKVGLFGLVQPFADAMKLLTKSLVYVSTGNHAVFYVSPGLMLGLMLTIWSVMPWLGGAFDFSWGVLYFLCVSSLGVYCLFGCGWASNSKYGLLGAMRGVAQAISYEVSLAMILIGVGLLGLSYDLFVYGRMQSYVWFGLVAGPLIVCWVVSIFAESNRSPFDFAEGESELVSGFNVEYSGVLFAFLFMAEYGMMVVMSLMSVIMFLGGMEYFLLSLWMIVFFIWVRGSFPRYRYDSLMYLVWSKILPLVMHWLLILGGQLALVLWVL
uniref:NADH-ubiquinone oxidoreductase chain 1 n=1 Tax=Spirobolus bungii TaxID=2798518 RepID=A0A7T6UYX4_9MYRI|nr:NADH dehydrogenase subunit 1 [Spirobolus bungii]QQJ94253.1 NADH dehydrogenase subunit 1 [Spirobolus bungii]